MSGMGSIYKCHQSCNFFSLRRLRQNELPCQNEDTTEDLGGPAMEGENNVEDLVDNL